MGPRWWVPRYGLILHERGTGETVMLIGAAEPHPMFAAAILLSPPRVHHGEPPWALKPGDRVADYPYSTETWERL
jgi:hypothetical protein